MTTATDITAGIPAIDHHSHAGYRRPGDPVQGFDGPEREQAMGYVEANIPHDAYLEYVAARVRGDGATMEALNLEHDIEGLVARSITFQSTTVHASALAEGARALHGDLPREEMVRVSKERREEDFVGLYDQALELAGTPAVLTDIPAIDPATWPHARYKPIARIDPYLYPFGHPPYTARGSDTPRFQRIFASVLDDQRALAGLDRWPATLADYLAFVEASLRRRQSEGFIGIKIASAYVRSLAFQPVTRAEAEAAYVMLRDGAEVDPIAWTRLADHLALEIAVLASRLEMPLQIHTGMGHAEPGLRLSHAHPSNLEEFLGSPRLNRLKVILIHGGYPFSSVLGAMAQSHGNVYLDFSWMPYLHHNVLRRALEEWLEHLPADKLMYGTDTGSPEVHLASTRRARTALSDVLVGGVGSGTWSSSQADWLAQRVLHQNLCDVYRIEVP